jgi:hypothetical protein
VRWVRRTSGCRPSCGSGAGLSSKRRDRRRGGPSPDAGHSRVWSRPRATTPSRLDATSPADTPFM